MTSTELAVLWLDLALWVITWENLLVIRLTAIRHLADSQNRPARGVKILPVHEVLEGFLLYSSIGGIGL